MPQKAQADGTGHRAMGFDLPDDEGLLTALRAAWPELEPREVVEREVFKRRKDWRGERTFERVRIHPGDSDALDLCIKYSTAAAGAELLGRAAEREEAAYRFLNGHPDAGAPRCWGSFEPSAGQSMLILEFVSGRRLKRSRDPATWLDLANRWGHVHGRVNAALPQRPEALSALPRCDAPALEAWATRAFAPVLERYRPVRSRAEQLLDDFLPAARALGQAPPTLVHGEYYCTNILVRERPGPNSFCPFDWETAFVGCGTLDIAYLGRTEMEVSRDALVTAYAEGWSASGATPQALADFKRQHAAARAYERVYFLWHAAEHRGVPERKVQKYLGLLSDLVSEFCDLSAAEVA